MPYICKPTFLRLLGKSKVEFELEEDKIWGEFFENSLNQVDKKIWEDENTKFLFKNENEWKWFRTMLYTSIRHTINVMRKKL